MITIQFAYDQHARLNLMNLILTWLSGFGAVYINYVIFKINIKINIVVYYICTMNYISGEERSQVASKDIC